MIADLARSALLIAAPLLAAASGHTGPVAPTGSAASEEPSPSAKPALEEERPVEATFRIDRGDQRLPIMVPRDERLKFDVRLNLGILGSPQVGKVTIKTLVEPLDASPLLIGDGAPQPVGERVLFEAVAEGAYKVYEVRDVTSTLILPQEWPAIVHRRVQTGSEHRRRELMIGIVDGVPTGEYRSDTHCKGCRSRGHYLKPAWPWQSEKHCVKCKRGEHRVWKDPKRKEVPAEAIDMLSAIQLARTMVAQGEQRLEFTMLDKLELWQVELERGERARQEVSAGSFDAVEIRLTTQPPEERKRDEDFEGLFGIQGSISMWFDELSGVPVLITGHVPAGPIKLNVRVELDSIR